MSVHHVRAPASPDWGPGGLLSSPSGSVLDVFFLRAGRRRVDTRQIRIVFGAQVLEREAKILDAAALANWALARHSVYVVRLRPEVLELKKFAKNNPPQTPGQERCLYVGLTGVSPKERLENHLRDHKASRYVRDYGLALEQSLFEHLNPLPYSVGQLMEEELARHLQSLGYAVWQN